MSSSKFESLPNEILIDLFERYLNGFDVINGFALQLNTRIDSLIHQCRRFRLDFSECRKDQFRLVLNRLPSYIDRIEELVLNEDNAPGQVATFASAFDSFESFRKLRRLYIQSNAAFTDRSPLFTMLQSLVETNVDELTVQGDLFYSQIPNYLQKLKRLTFSKRIYEISADTFPHVQYLTLTDDSYNLLQFDSILKYTPLLKYLHIKLSMDQNRGYLSMPTIDLAQKSLLETWLVHLDEYVVSPWNLGRYFRAMPKLRRLQLTGNESFLNASLWQELFSNILTNLTHLRLYFIVAGIAEEEIRHRLELFQTPFWIAEENFQIIIKNKKFLGIERNRSLFLDQYADHCWIGPRRNGIIPRNPMRTLSLPNDSLSLVPSQTFDRLTTLIVHQLTNDLRTIMLVNSINFLRIQHLTVSISEHEPQEIESFLSLFPNLETLCLPLRILFSLSTHSSISRTKLKSLDLSSVTHSFEEDDIHRIQQFFPNLKHLSINTENLRSIPLLNSLLPNLCSLRCVPPYKISPFSEQHVQWELKMRHVSQQMNNTFYFRQRCPILWIDHNK